MCSSLLGDWQERSPIVREAVTNENFLDLELTEPLCPYIWPPPFTFHSLLNPYSGGLPEKQYTLCSRKSKGPKTTHERAFKSRCLG